MKTSDVLKLAKASFMEALTTRAARMSIYEPLLHIVSVCHGDTDAANMALSFLPSHEDRFDAAIARAEMAEDANGGLRLCENCAMGNHVTCWRLLHRQTICNCPQYCATLVARADVEEASADLEEAGKE